MQQGVDKLVLKCEKTALSIVLWCVAGSELEDGEPYRWQLDCGRGWKSIENDHILEAHYSRPGTKGINLYNTPNG